MQRIPDRQTERGEVQVYAYTEINMHTHTPAVSKSVPRLDTGLLAVQKHFNQHKPSDAECRESNPKQYHDPKKGPVLISASTEGVRNTSKP